MLEKLILGVFIVLGYVAGTLVKVGRYIRAAFIEGYQMGNKS